VVEKEGGMKKDRGNLDKNLSLALSQKKLFCLAWLLLGEEEEEGLN
jgi:hypothetical protein